MTDAAIRRMTVEEFLDWDGGGDRRHELRRGVPVMMAPGLAVHARLSGTLAAAIGPRLRGRPPCAVYVEAGLRSALRADTVFVPDLVVSCARVTGADQLVPDPILVVEILSPSTAKDDRGEKLPDYRAMPSVREILLIEPEAPQAELHCRLDGDRWLTTLLRGAARTRCWSWRAWA
jgi:Uma2 family endonuclease